MSNLYVRLCLPVLVSAVFACAGSSGVTAAAASATFSPQAELNDVTCAGGVSCVAVGFRQSSSSGRDVALVENSDGGNWSILSSPSPAHATGAGLYGVSCISSTVCEAVGYATIDGNTASFAEHWNGRRWSLQSVPAPAGATSDGLIRVSCGSARSCVAVGFSSLGLLSEAWNGQNWSAEPISAPDGGGKLADLACISARKCFAVGYDLNGNGNDSPLAERWNGSSWSIQHMPDLATSPNIELTGISCTSASACVSVGYGSIGVITALWNGHRWKVENAPNTNNNDDLDDVSCVPGGSCYAVGNYLNISTGSDWPAIEAWSGTNWTAQQVADPPGSDDTYLEGVSCGSSTSCLAVGDYTEAGFTTLSESGPGSSWMMGSPVN